MRPRRLVALVAIAGLLLVLLPAVGSAEHASLQLVPPAGQTAVKGGDSVAVEGTAEADADVREETLLALDEAGAVLGSYDLSGILSNDGGTLSGSVLLGCGVIPGCLDGDPELRASVDGYQLVARVVSGIDDHELASQVIEFDEAAPYLLGYFLIGDDGASSNQVEVRFSEDVADPEGDAPGDWTVEGLRQVTDVSGEGDRRVLTTAASFGPDDTPQVRYDPQRSLIGDLPNEPYVDEAGNTLRARNRFATAADRIAPAPPTIDAIDGTATTRDSDDQAVPVLGSDPTPTVTVGSMTDGHTARLFLDDGDGTLEDDRDTLVGEATASGGSAEVAWPDDLALPDGEHRLFARALDGAACDPDDSTAGDCPNASGRSQDALYDLDTAAPTLDDPALASTSAVTVVFSEPVAGYDAASDWTLTNPDGTAGPTVTGVSGSGDARVLEVDGVLPDSSLTYAPAGGRYVDDHDNVLADATIGIAAQPLPVARLVDAPAADEQDGPDEVAGLPDPSYVENQAVFRVELSGPPREGETVTVDLQVVADTATADVDYTDPGPISVELTGDQTGVDVPVELIGDTVDEFDETFQLRVTRVSNAVVGDDTAVGTILDDDAPVEVSVADATVTEGGTAEVTVSLTAASGKPVTVDWALRPATATAGEDYDDETGSVVIPAGETEGLIEVATVEDRLDEADESFDAVLGEATNAIVGDGEATVTITDDDEPPSLRISDLETFEGDETRTEQLVVSLSETSGRNVTVDWSTAPGTATAGEDYTADQGTVEIPAGASRASIPVEILGDADGEDDEAFTVALSNEANAQVGKGTGTVTLLDDDGGLPPITVRVTGGEIGEGDALLPQLFPAEVTWTVELSEPARGPVRVQYRTTDDGTATTLEDFEEASGTVEIPAGETTVEISADVIADDLHEGDETAALLVGDPVGAQLLDDDEEPVDTLTSFATIVDDDPAPTVTYADGSVTQAVSEGDPAIFTVELSEVSGREATVDWATVFDGTATSTDLLEQSGTVTIPAGQISESFQVTTIDNEEPDGDRTVSIELSTPTDAELGSPSTSTLTITDDDLDATVVSLTGDAVEEGDPGAPLPVSVGRTELEFAVQLSRPADGEVIIDYTTRPGSATAGADYETTSGQVTVVDGEAEATVTVPVVPDFADEFDEDLQLVLTDVSGDAVLPGGELARTGRILDDDPEAQLRVSDATVLEGDVAELDVTLDNASGKDITTDWALVDGSAAAGEDYVTDSGTLSFAAGATSRTVHVATLGDDDTGELIEQLELVLSNATNAGLGDPRGTVSIIDLGVDGLPTATAVFLEDTTVEEADGDRTALVPVRLSGERDQDTTVTWSSQQLSATDGEDYRADGGQVVIPAGATSAQIAVTILGDDDPEPDEDFLVLLTEADGAVITGPTGRVTITDDDSGDGSGDDSPGGGDDGVDGAPDGSDSDDGDQGAGDLAATGGGAGFVVFGLGLLAARRRRREAD